jgi:hypothetical protein
MGSPNLKTGEQVETTTLGEAMIERAPLSRGPLRHIGTFAKRIGATELNVAVGLSRLGHRAGMDNAEPRTPLSTTPTSFRQWCEEVLKPAVLA